MLWSGWKKGRRGEARKAARRRSPFALLASVDGGPRGGRPPTLPIPVVTLTAGYSDQFGGPVTSRAGAPAAGAAAPSPHEAGGGVGTGCGGAQAGKGANG